MVDWLADRVEESSQNSVTNRCADRCAQGADPRSTPEPGSAAQRHNPHPRRPQMLLHFCDKRRAEIPVDRNGIIDRRQDAARERDIDDRTVDRSYAAQGHIRIERLHRNRHSLKAHGSHHTVADSSAAALIQLNAPAVRVWEH
jgi:hypothetical protein